MGLSSVTNQPEELVRPLLRDQPTGGISGPVIHDQPTRGVGATTSSRSPTLVRRSAAVPLVAGRSAETPLACQRNVVKTWFDLVWVQWSNGRIRRSCRYGGRYNTKTIIRDIVHQCGLPERFVGSLPAPDSCMRGLYYMILGLDSACARHCRKDGSNSGIVQMVSTSRLCSLVCARA